jgi:hypothetical protein
MEFNIVAILTATVAQFIIGALWYSALFGKLWGRIHGFDKLSKEAQKNLQNESAPFYVVQFIMTIITTVVLYIFIVFLPHDWNVYALVAFFWVGFVLPTQVAAVIFGGTEKKWMIKKIAVQSGAALLCLEAAALIIHLFV